MVKSSRTAPGQRTSSNNIASQPHLTRLHSGTHLDDQSHHHVHEPQHDQLNESDDFSDVELQQQTSSQETLREDVEANAALGKSKSGRSDRDPNIVTWARDDPENPKNWSMKRKWAATFIGM